MSAETSARGAGSQTTTVLVDAHVHLHRRFDEGRFFEAASRNFARAAESMRSAGTLHDGTPWHGVLVLTEASGADRFGDLVARVGSRVAGRWTIDATSESSSVRLRSGDASDLTLVAGRQIQTAEGLEVLAFPCVGPTRDGRPILEVLRELADHGAVRMIPWGFGKWSGRRGRMLRTLLETGPAFLLADTGHRPGWAPEPSPLSEAVQRGRPVLTGSDPLPLAGEETRAGSCCFLIDVHGFADRPSEALATAISALDRSPFRFEQRVGLGRFTVSQAAMQVRKRVR